MVITKSTQRTFTKRFLEKAIKHRFFVCQQTSTVFPSSKTSGKLLEFSIFLAKRGAKVGILAKYLRVFQQTLKKN